MRPLVSLREALAHPGLLGSALSGASWAAWRIVLMAAMGEPLKADELPIFAALTGRTSSPTARVDEMAAVVGRRGGKSRGLSTAAVYIATLCDHSAVLASGERGIVLLIAPSQRQAHVSLDYCASIIADSPELRNLVTSVRADSISLSNGIDIEVRAANFRQLRGVTCVAVLADEVAFLADDGSGSANPDIEILNAVRPSLATTKGPLLIASSPYRKAGALWDIYRENYGPDGDPSILVVKGASRDFNPSLDQKVVDRAMARDPAAASAEFLATFRNDIESYVSAEVVDACVDHGVRERPPVRYHRYFSFVDVAGGSGQDSFTLAVAHREGGTVVVDAIREVRPPFSPSDTVRDYSRLLRTYGITHVSGDRYGGDWPKSEFQRYGIHYRLSDLNKSEIYIESLPRLNSRTIRLLDNERLVNQITGLERRHGRTGRDIVDHAPRSHDDIANAVFGASALVGKPSGIFIGAIGPDGRVTETESRVKRRFWRRRWIDEDGNEISPARLA